MWVKRIPFFVVGLMLMATTALSGGGFMGSPTGYSGKGLSSLGGPVITQLVNQGPGFAILTDAAAGALANEKAFPEQMPNNVDDGSPAHWDANNQIWTTPSYFYSHAGGQLWYPNADFQKVTGSYTGTTQQILRYAAAKYGMDEDWMYADAQEENGWKEDCAIMHGGTGCNEGGDCYNPDGTNTSGAGFANWTFLGFNATDSTGAFIGNQGLTSPSLCASWGILQTKAAYAEDYTWPMLAISTAWNADYRAAKWRSCMNGGTQQTNHFGTDYSNAVTQATSHPNALASAASPAFTGPTTTFPNETDLQYLAVWCYASHFSGGWHDLGAECYADYNGGTGSGCSAGFATDNLIYNLAHDNWPGGLT